MSRFYLALSVLLFAAAAQGFVVQPPASSSAAIASCRPRSALAATTENDKAGSEASAFVPLDENVEMDDETLEKVEMFGKGAAKVRTNYDDARWLKMA